MRAANEHLAEELKELFDDAIQGFMVVLSDPGQWKAKSERRWAIFHSAISKLPADDQKARQILDKHSRPEAFTAWRYIICYAAQRPSQQGEAKSIATRLLLSDVWRAALLDTPNLVHPHPVESAESACPGMTGLPQKALPQALRTMLAAAAPTCRAVASPGSDGLSVARANIEEDQTVSCALGFVPEQASVKCVRKSGVKAIFKPPPKCVKVDTSLRSITKWVSKKETRAYKDARSGKMKRVRCCCEENSANKHRQCSLFNVVHCKKLNMNKDVDIAGFDLSWAQSQRRLKHFRRIGTCAVPNHKIQSYYEILGTPEAYCPEIEFGATSRSYNHVKATRAARLGDAVWVDCEDQYRPTNYPRCIYYSPDEGMVDPAPICHNA
jgi:hypothetical protein